MYKNIVVGTDGSETAALAVAHALQLAQLGGGVLHIVHAVQNVSLGMAAVSASSGGPAVDLDRLNASIADNGNAVVADAVALAAADGVSAQAHVVAAEPSDALIGVAEKVGADLVVVGNRGMTGARRFVLGSVPNRISHHCPCNLLIVNTAGS